MRFVKSCFSRQALFRRYSIFAYKSLLCADYLFSKAVTIMPVGVVITPSVVSWKLHLLRLRVHD
jgi:hypothetical protein